MKPLDVSSLRDVVGGASPSLYFGLVVKRDGESSHYAQADGEIHVEVDLMPDQIPVTAILSSSIGSVGHGIWKIPPVGTEVIVAVPSDLQGEAVILGCTPTGQTPSDLDETTLVVTNGAKVKIISESDDDSADIEITAAGDVKINTSSGKTVQLNGTDYSALKTEDLLADLKTLCTHLAAWIPLVVTAVNTAPLGTAADPGAATQATAIITAINAGTYKSTKVQNG